MDKTEVDKMSYIREYLTDQMQYKNNISGTVNQPEATDIDTNTYNESTQISNRLQKKRVSFDGSSNTKASNEFCSIKEDMISHSFGMHNVRKVDVLKTPEHQSNNSLVSITSPNIYDTNIKARSSKCSIGTRNGCEFERETFRSEQRLPTLSITKKCQNISEQSKKLLERSKLLNQMMEGIKPKKNLLKGLIIPKAATKSLLEGNVNGNVNRSSTSLECSSGYGTFEELSEDESAAAHLLNVISHEHLADNTDITFKEKESYNTWNYGRSNIVSKIVNSPNNDKKEEEIVIKSNLRRNKITPNLIQQLNADEGVSGDSGNVFEEDQFTGTTHFQGCNVLPNIRHRLSSIGCHRNNPERTAEKKQSTRITRNKSPEGISDFKLTIKRKKKQRKMNP